MEHRANGLEAKEAIRLEPGTVAAFVPMWGSWLRQPLSVEGDRDAGIRTGGGMDEVINPAREDNKQARLRANKKSLAAGMMGHGDHFGKWARVVEFQNSR
jgi:hypothetical protein